MIEKMARKVPKTSPLALDQVLRRVLFPDVTIGAIAAVFSGTNQTLQRTNGEYIHTKVLCSDTFRLSARSVSP